MSAVKQKTLNGRSTDQLDGLDLEDGECILVKWPDSEELEQFTVSIDDRHCDRDRLAYIVAPTHGTTNRIYLRWQATVMVKRCNNVA